SLRFDGQREYLLPWGCVRQDENVLLPGERTLMFQKPAQTFLELGLGIALRDWPQGLESGHRSVFQCGELTRILHPVRRTLRQRIRVESGLRGTRDGQLHRFAAAGLS